MLVAFGLVGFLALCQPRTGSSSEADVVLPVTGLPFRAPGTSGSGPIQLEVAEREGHWRLRVTGEIGWSGQPDYPAVVAIRDANGATLGETTLKATPRFDLAVAVQPGSYSLVSASAHDAGDRVAEGVLAPRTEGHPTYWGLYGPTMHVNPSGELLLKNTGGDLVHVMLIEGIRPSGRPELTSPPRLSWEAIEGARLYRVRWFEVDAATDEVLETKQNIPIEGTSYTFPYELKDGCRYSWDVEAYADERGQTQLARGFGFFTTPLGARAVARVSVPSPRDAWLGVHLGQHRGAVAELFDVSPEAVFIRSVAPGSPAGAAGLMPADVITAVDGVSMTSIDDVVQAIGRRAPGLELVIEIVRDRVPMEVSVVLGEPPTQ